jgi:FKBP-type peptidyl-prolyl cis-trans isomerase FklB
MRILKNTLPFVLFVLFNSCDSKQDNAILHAENKAEGVAFLEENASATGVVTTQSGLQYKVLKEGSGTAPTGNSSVEVHYHGTFIDGHVFDSSVDRGTSITFGLNRVIQGWTEGLQLMRPGAIYKLYIPYNLAYGAQGRGGIPPYSALIFEVELIQIF